MTTINATIKVAIPNYRPPYVISKNQGFDVRLMRLICKTLKETCEFYPMEFYKIYGALDDKSVDLAIGALSISEARVQLYIFSIPYKVSEGQFIVRKNSPIKSLNDLSGKKVGTLTATVFEDFLVDKYGLKIQIVPFKGIIDTIDALDQEIVDVIFLDNMMMKYWRENSDHELESLGDSIVVGDGFGIMALPEQAPLIKLINKSIKKLEKDYIFLRLYATYFSK